MKKLLALSTLVGTAGLVAFGTTINQQNNISKEENIDVVLNSSDNSGYSQHDSNWVKRISEEFDRYVQPGDIWYDYVGKRCFIGDSINTGHIGIVIGKHAENGITVLDVVESNPGSGVAYGIVHPDRFIEQKSQILRVKTTNEKMNKAIDFCKKKADEKAPYPYYSGTPEFHWKKTANQTRLDSLYNAELVWSAFKNIGIDIEKELNGDIEKIQGVTPREIISSEKTRFISMDNYFSYVKPGDILYLRDEYLVTKNVFLGKSYWRDYTGYVGIVKDRVWDANIHEYKISVYDATPKNGVTNHYFTYNDFTSKGAQIYRVDDAQYRISEVIRFCENQRNVPYSNCGNNYGIQTKKTLNDWYCSELVYAAYFEQGVNLEGTLNGVPEKYVELTPAEIAADNDVYPIVRYDAKRSSKSPDDDYHYTVVFEDGNNTVKETHNKYVSGNYIRCTSCSKIWSRCS